MQIFFFVYLKQQIDHHHFHHVLFTIYMLRYQNRDTFSFTIHANLFRKNKN